MFEGSLRMMSRWQVDRRQKAKAILMKEKFKIVI